MDFSKMEEKRRREKISVRKFCNDTGISSRTYYIMIRGDNVSMMQVERVCRYLKEKPENIVSRNKNGKGTLYLVSEEDIRKSAGGNIEVLRKHPVSVSNYTIMPSVFEEPEEE